MRQGISLAIAAIASAALAAPGGAPAATRTRTWVLPAVDKVRPVDLPSAFHGTQVVAARGARRAFQVAVRAPAGTSVSLRVRAPNGFGPRLYVEGVVDVTEPSPGRGARSVGGWPDILVPGARFTSDGTTHLFWVDVTVGRGVADGSYRMSLRLGVGRRVRRLVATVRVIGTQPPAALTGLAGIYDPANANVATARLLAAYRLPAGEWTEPQRTLARLMRFQSVVQLPGQSDPARYGRSLRAAMGELRRLGVAGRNIAYVADEPGCGQLAAAERRAAQARAADAAIRPLVTISPGACRGAAASRLPDVRIFVPTERNAEASWSARVAQWIYPNSGRAGPGFTTFALDDPGPASLLIGWRAALLGARGVLYWSADIWSRGFDPYTTTLATFAGQGYPGDGVLVYPGRRASLRLALYREGALDADLVRCAGRRGLELAATVAPASRRLVRSSRRILSVRAALAIACAVARAS